MKHVSQVLIMAPIILLAMFASCNKIDVTDNPLNGESKGIATNAARISNPNLMFEETFEESTFFPLSGTTINKTYGIENCNSSSTTTPANYDWTLSRKTNPVFQDLKSVRYEIRKDQPRVGSSQSIRSEVTIIKGNADSRFTPDIWYSFAVLFPSIGMENDDTRDAINQWYEDGTDETTIRVEKGKAFLEVTPPAGVSSLKKYDLFAPGLSSDGSVTSFVSIPKDKWHEFVFHFVHSKGSDGLIEVWRDGVKIHHIVGRNMHYQYPKWKVGIYKSSFSSSKMYSRVLYFDNIRVGKSSATLADMSSVVNTTPNPDPTVNTAPTINLTSPTTNSSFNAPATISIAASAADGDGTISNVAFYNGTTLLGNDNSSPYSFSWSNVAAGNYTITAKATDNAGAVTTSAPVSISVGTTTPPVAGTQTIVSYTLVNSGTEKDIKTITNGETISLKATGASKFNIRANTSPSIVGSVKFELSGKQAKIFTDNAFPYALHGDDKAGNYYYGNWNPPALGTYTLKTTPYSGSNATGTAGSSNSVTFTIIN